MRGRGHIGLAHRALIGRKKKKRKKKKSKKREPEEQEKRARRARRYYCLVFVKPWPLAQIR